VDWQALTAHRRQRAAAEPAGWREAVAHLADCPPCRRQALAADPTLLFQGLPDAAVDAGEVAAMRAGVAALRRARALASTAVDRRDSRRPAPDRHRRLLQGVAAAGLAAAALTLTPAARVEGPLAPDAPAAVGAALPATVWGPELLSEVGQLPMVEEVAGPEGRIYQLRQGDFAVVMVVDESLDI
jgi:hypothetical protein